MLTNVYTYYTKNKKPYGLKWVQEDADNPYTEEIYFANKKRYLNIEEKCIGLIFVLLKNLVN